MFGLILTAALAPAAPPVDPDPKHLIVAPAEQARAAALVEKLASPRYEDREKAQDELAAMGRKAVPTLTEALTRHASAEVRARCQTLFPRARADDLQVRLAVFLADKEGRFEHELPGWAEFKQTTAGCGPAARAVFAELVASPIGRELLLTDLHPQDLGQRISLRKTDVYQRRLTASRTGQVQEPAAIEVLALMLAETRTPSRYVQTMNNNVVLMLYTSTGFTSALNGGRQARVYRAIAGKWVASRDTAVLMYQAFTVGQALDLPEVADLGARMMKTAAVTPLNKAQAAMAVAKVGDAKHLPALESALKDESVVPAGGIVVAAPAGVPAAARGLQLRDVALAAALLLTQQNPTEYGFESSVVAPAAGARYTHTMWRLSPDRRAAALERWAEWRAANPDYGRIR